MEGKRKTKMIQVVYKGKTKVGLEYIIKYPDAGDAEKMCDYINTISQERTFIRYQGEVVTLDEEKTFLNNQLNKIKNNRAIMLLLEIDGKILGISGIEMRDKAERHTGEFGISILNGFRGQGLGKLLMDLVIEEAKKNLVGLKIITLSVFENNIKALNMYQKFGFAEFGNLKGGVLHRGKAYGHVFMHKVI